jgi:hypothetical protein
MLGLDLQTAVMIILTLYVSKVNRLFGHCIYVIFTVIAGTIECLKIKDYLRTLERKPCQLLLTAVTSTLLCMRP